MQTEVFDEDREYEFEVVSTGRTMGMFSSTVYTDRPLAIVRELIFNARDAHIAAGKPDEAIIIHLPSKAEPHFSVKDNGTGLSPQMMVQVYVRFGMSTKDGISATGKLGIGAKAPLSFINYFTVVSRVDGIKRTYRVSRENEHAKPKLGVPVREDTDEGNGLEVIVDVKNTDDHKSFAKALREILAYFDPDPVVLNAPEGFAANKPDVAYAGDGWRLLNEPRGKRTYSYQVLSKECRAVMAGIPYPIEPKKIPNVSDTYEALFKNDIDIDFKPESLTFNAGREALSYDSDKTIPNLKRRAARVVADMKVRVDEVFDRYETRLQALDGYRRRRGVFPFGVLMEIAKVRWKGEEIDGRFHIPIAEVPGVAIKIDVFTGKSYSNVRRDRTTTEYGADGKDRHGRSVETASVSVPQDGEIHILIDDVERGAGVRFRDYQKAAWTGTFVTLKGDQASIDQILAIFDGVENVKRASELAPAKVDKPKTQAKIIPRMGSQSAGSIDKNVIWSYDIDMEDGGYYVLTRMGNPDGVTEREFKDMYVQSHNLGFFNDQETIVAVVPATVSGPFEKNPAWKLFVPEMRKKAKALLAKPESHVIVANARDFAEVRNEQSAYLSSLNNLLPALPKDNALHGIMALYERRYADYNMGNDLTILSRTFGLGDLPHTVKDPLNAQFAAFYQRYPLLLSVLKGSRYYFDVHNEEGDRERAEWAAPIAEYIALIDGKDGRDPGTATKPEPRRARQSWSAQHRSGPHSIRGSRARASA